MVLTSSLVVTVGLSLTIPLSLVGELIVQGRSESFIYWIAAIIVVCSFLFVDREEVKEEGHDYDDEIPAEKELVDSTGYASSVQQSDTLDPLAHG
jgi:solute carrier family 35, member F5